MCNRITILDYNRIMFIFFSSTKCFVFCCCCCCCFREFLFHLSTPKVQATNPNFVLKVNVVCDRSDPNVVFELTPEQQGTYIFANTIYEYL